MLKKVGSVALGAIILATGAFVVLVIIKLFIAVIKA